MMKCKHKHKGGYLSALLVPVLIAGSVILYAGCKGGKSTDLQAIPTDPAPSYTTSAEAQVLTTEPSDYTPLRYYRSTLTAAEQELYDIIATAIGGFAPSVEGIRDFSSQELFEVTEFVVYDHPEYFWFDGEIYAQTTTLGSATQVDLEFSYTMTPEEAAEMQLSIRSATDSYLENMADLDDREKVEYVYHRLGTDTLYDLGHNDQSFCTVLLDHVGLCAGYSRSMQYILSRAGLDILYLTGTDLNGEPHSWNVVKVDGNWYHTDATWGDPLVQGGDPGDGSNQTFAYLFLSTDEVLQNHVINAPERIPVCTDRSLGYYRRLGLLFDGVTDELRAVLREAAENDQPLTFQATDTVAFAALSSSVQGEENLLTEIGRQVGQARNMSRYSYAYRLDETTRCIRVEFVFTP